MCLFLSSFYFECKDGTCSVGEILFVERMVGMIGQCRMVHLLYFRMIFQIIYYFQRIFYVAFHTQGERFQSLQQNECIERAYGCSRITQQDGTNADRICSRARCIDKAYAVVAGIGLG